MHKAGVLRVSSTRNLCVFCATRQLSNADAGLPCRTAQRRLLNSSSKTPQYSAEGMVYKDENRQTSAASRQALQMQRLFASSNQSSPSHVTYPLPPRGRASTLTSHRQTQRQAPLRRVPLPTAGFDRGAGRGQVDHRIAHAQSYPRTAERRGLPTNSDPLYGRSSRYQVTMDSEPPVRDVPAFGAGHLRRRSYAQQDPFPREAPAPRRVALPTKSAPAPGRLEQSEIDTLLNGNAKTGQRFTYTPLNRDSNTRTKCMHCGRQDHTSFDCPNKPVLRQQADPALPQRFDALDEAAAAWHSTHSNKQDEVFSTSRELRQPSQYVDEFERKKSRPRNFTQNAMPARERNRYEEPARRRSDHRGGFRARRQHEDEDEDDDYFLKAERKRQKQEAKKKMQEAKAGPTPVHLPEFISVNNLAALLKVRLEDFVSKLEELGFEEVQHDHILNAEHAGLIAQEYDFEPILQSDDGDGDLHPAPAPSPEEYAQLPLRPPVVTIMGHVDHGKTTILDYMRSTSVAASEFGGITQHIGAFSVPLASGKKITFLDTPGHAAFETMRARGANVTDIVVLVVAADDSVMPQTIEAIKHAQAAKVPMIVAINKIDKSQADVDAVKLDLGRHGIEVEDFGGEVQAIPLSGKTGQGIPDLEEAITTLSEMLDHRADPKASVEGWVLEGTTKKSGKVATVLVRSGTLRLGDILVAGTTWTRVRSLRNESGVAVQEVGPGMPVEVDGWREQPIAGDEVLQASDEQHAQAVSDLRHEKVERERMAKDMEAINESRRLEAERREAEEAAARAAANGEDIDTADVATKESGPEIIPFIIKGDVSGSVEAVIDSVSGLGNAEIATRVLRSGVGSPSEFDIQHAAAAQGHIINFNTAVPPHIAALAESKGVKILDNNIIYRVVENVKTLLEERLPPRVVQKVTGEVEVAMVFEIGLGGKKKMKVAGSKVRNGYVEKGTKAKVLRKGEVVFEGIISSLKNQKKDVEQMRKDTECGIAFAGWEDFQQGDKIQCFEEEKIKRSL